MSEKDIKEVGGNQVYELGFHLVPTLGDDTVGKAFDKVIKLVEKVGGKVVSKSGPALLNLEYTMEKTVDSIKTKYNTAYFAWVIFEGGDVQKLEEESRHDKDILRHLIIKTSQKESLSAEEVASTVNGDEKISEVEEEVEEEKTEDSKEEITEEVSEEKTNEDKVDEAIDDLIKE